MSSFADLTFLNNFMLSLAEPSKYADHVFITYICKFYPGLRKFTRKVMRGPLCLALLI